MQKREVQDNTQHLAQQLEELEERLQHSVSALENQLRSTQPRVMRDMKTLKAPQKYGYEDEGEVGMNPLVTKGRDVQYVLWTFMDMGLCSQLPDLCNGGQRWVTKFEEKTAGHTLSIDVKAILAQTVGKAKTGEILNEAGLKGAIDEPGWDVIALGPWINRL